MKVREVYERALAFLPEDMSANQDMQKFMVPWANTLMADTMEAENIYRKSENMPLLAVPPMVTEREQEIPYNERLVAKAFPYGMARWIFLEDEQVGVAREYYQYYAQAVYEATPALITDVEDAY